MKRSLFYAVVSSLIVFGCTDEKVDVLSNPEMGMTGVENNAEFNKALESLKEFGSAHGNGGARLKSLDMSGLNVLNVEERTYTFNRSELGVRKENLSRLMALSSKTRFEEKVSVKVYTVSFEKDGYKGYAIMSGDDRTSKVYVYVPYGDLSDTTYIAGAKDVIENVENMCRQDLRNYFTRGENEGGQTVTTMASKPTHLVVQPLTGLAWNQTYPYNKYAPYSCSNIDAAYNGLAPAGCTPIAIAQVVAYLCPPAISSKYDLPLLRKYRFVDSYFPIDIQNKVGRFIKEGIADLVNTHYGCEGTKAKIRYIRDDFDDWGIDYDYAEDKNVDCGKVAYNLMNGYPHITCGFTKRPRSGHTWIFEGVDCYYTGVNNGKLVIADHSRFMFYCNWGWGGTSNMWYIRFETPNNPDGSPGGTYLDDNCQLYIYNTRFPKMR